MSRDVTLHIFLFECVEDFDFGYDCCFLLSLFKFLCKKNGIIKSIQSKNIIRIQSRLNSVHDRTEGK